LNNIHLNINAEPLLIIFAVILIFGLIFYYYKYTLPPLGRALKLTLVAVRGITISLVVLILFEPSIAVKTNKTKLKTTAVFLDNSGSVSKYKNEALNLLSSLKETFSDKNLPLKFYSFAEKVKSINPDSLENISFKRNSTNFNQLFDSLKKADNLSGAVIISDGDYNSGRNPVNLSEQSGVRIFTVGLGDTVAQKDISVNQITKNELIYKNKKTTIGVEIKSTGFTGDKVEVILSKGKTAIEKKAVELNESGITELQFEFTQAQTGQRRLTFSVSTLPGEISKLNNRKTFYLNVLKGKINVLMITSSPSADFGFIFNSLKSNPDIHPMKILDLKNNPAAAINYSNKLDSSDALILLGFPLQSSDRTLTKTIEKLITNSKKPFFIFVSEETGTKFLKNIQNGTGIVFQNRIKKMVEVQPIPVDEENVLIANNGAGYPGLWEDLSPIGLIPVQPKIPPGTNTILKSRINGAETNFPVYISHNMNGVRSLTFMGKNIWRWKLSPKDNSSMFYDELIVTAVKWLNAANLKKKISVEPVKRVFASGERIYFVGDIFDDALNPVENADVKVRISGDDYSSTISLLHYGGGIYKNSAEALAGGNYKYESEIKMRSQKVKIITGNFSVEKFSVEKLNSTRNRNILNLVAASTRGKYYDIENSSSLIKLLASNSNSMKKTIVIKSEYNLWQYEFTLILIILLFSLEWFLRKRAGLL